MTPARFTQGAAALLLAIAAGACSESTSPDRTATGGSFFDGEEVVLQRVEMPGPGGQPVRVDLVGTDVEIGADGEEVSVAVAVRNRSDSPLYPPGVVWIFSLDPPGVEVIEPDLVQPTTTSGPAPRYGFDYSELLGDDGVLAPGETSGSKRWRFHDPALAPFTFGAAATFALEPDGSFIAGRIFDDRNRDGHAQPDEPPYTVGIVSLVGPSGALGTAEPDAATGRYRFPIETTGLYRLTYLRPNFPEFPLTTPNPLSVLVTPGPDGAPQSIRNADFGVRIPAPPDSLPVILVESPGEVEPQDAYGLLSIDVIGHVLRLGVGFGGCSPDHPFTLYASSAWMESDPPQVLAVLSHDDRGEPCDAWFVRTLDVDLTPLIEHYLDTYGAPVEFLLRFRDAEGEDHVVTVAP